VDQVRARADALMVLDARAWGRLLKLLRARVGRRPGDDGHDVASPVPAWTTLLATPSSELASGAPRRALCDAVADDQVLVDDLVSEPGLPPDLLTALSATALGAHTDGTDTDDADTDGTDTDAAGEGDGADPQRRDRLRATRRELEQVRRQRDGADARAVRAEARAETLTRSLAEREEELVRLRAALGAFEDEMRSAVSREARRSSARVAELEASLGEERRDRERLRRELERDRGQLEASREEVAQLRAEVERLGAALPSVPSAAGTSERPLVLPPDLHPETTEAARWLLERVDLLVVDGYNVALRAFPDVDLEAQRRMLLDRLRPLVARGGAQPLVIFDGEGPSGSASRVSGLEVRFSSGTVIADDEIVFVVAATERTVLVVTDDRELRARVRAEGANVVGGPALLGALER